jgi:hypothetical protein
MRPTTPLRLGTGPLRFGHDVPQVAEMDTPRSMDVAGEYLLYDERMTRAYIADTLSSGADAFVSKSETPERAAVCLQAAAEGLFHE